MRYGYDINNPIEREMLLNRFERNFKRANNKDLTLQEGLVYVMKEHREEMEYFIQREKQEKYIRFLFALTLFIQSKTVL